MRWPSAVRRTRPQLGRGIAIGVVAVVGFGVARFFVAPAVALGVRVVAHQRARTGLPDVVQQLLHAMQKHRRGGHGQQQEQGHQAALYRMREAAYVLLTAKVC